MYIVVHNPVYVSAD